MQTNEQPDLQLRPIDHQDLPCLFSIYASTRTEELAATGWSEAEQQQFLWQQFNTQHRYYQDIYTGAAFDLVLWQGDVAGRLYVGRWTQEIRIIDIALLPAFRGMGIGTRLLQALLDDADISARSICIHVEQQNPARRLYERLGFQIRENVGFYWRMERPPQPVSQQVPA